MHLAFQIWNKVFDFSRLTFFALSIGLLATACSTKEKTIAENPTLKKEIHPEKLKEDLSFMMKTLEDVHPDLYAFTKFDTIKALKKRIEKQLTKPLSPQDFYKKIAPLIATLGDGHTGVNIPYDDYMYFLDEGGRVFPYLVSHRDRWKSIFPIQMKMDLWLETGFSVLTACQ